MTHLAISTGDTEHVHLREKAGKPALPQSMCVTTYSVYAYQAVEHALG